MIEITDQLHRKISLENFPKRIVSLVPSQTELLFALGLDEEVIGITKFCVHPEKWFAVKTKIGGTKNINIEKIKSLHPDLVIANKEENVKEQIEELEKYFPVYVSDVNNLNNAFEMISDIGSITDRDESSAIIIQKIKERFSKLSSFNLHFSVLYLIWQKPYITIGRDTFIAEMLRCCGFQNIYENEKRYPEISISHLSSVNCQFILLSSEPFPFKQKHADEIISLRKNSNTKVLLVDGEMFSWYGSRLLLAADYFEKLLQQIL